MALAQRQVSAGWIHHSDRGREYCSNVSVERLLDFGASISISISQPSENAFAESLFKAVKGEEVYLHQYRTFEEVQASLQMFLEDVYNAKRLHSSLDDAIPICV
jgi:putative transposase